MCRFAREQSNILLVITVAITLSNSEIDIAVLFLKRYYESLEISNVEVTLTTQERSWLTVFSLWIGQALFSKHQGNSEPQFGL